MDAGVSLPGRLRHHLYAAIEDFFAGHDEPRLPAAEERREERPEMPVHAFEGLAQELARLAVNLADRILQRRHPLFEVGGLRIEGCLALAAGAQLLHRRQVHRAEFAERLRNPRDLALQAPRTR